MSAAPDAGTFAVAGGLAIRLAGPEAAALFSALHAQCFGEPWSAASIERILASPGVIASVACQAQQLGRPEIAPPPAGFAMTRHSVDEAELLSLGVLPGLRRRGVASLLLRDAIARAAASGARRMFLEVATDNVGAQALYAAHGFNAVGRRRGYYSRAYGPAVDALTLARAI